MSRSLNYRLVNIIACRLIRDRARNLVQVEGHSDVSAGDLVFGSVRSTVLLHQRHDHRALVVLVRTRRYWSRQRRRRAVFWSGEQLTFRRLETDAVLRVRPVLVYTSRYQTASAEPSLETSRLRNHAVLIMCYGNCRTVYLCIQFTLSYSLWLFNLILK